MKLFITLFTLPTRLWDSLFRFKIHYVEDMTIICPDYEHLVGLSELLNAPENVSFSVNSKIKINNQIFELADNELAVITTRKRWWRKTPSVTIKIFIR